MCTQPREVHEKHFNSLLQLLSIYLSLSLGIYKQSIICGNLGNSVLQQTKSHSYLGVEINQDLKWDTHINKITAKANRSLGFIRRNLASCPKNLKAQAYTTLVRLRPLLEYSSTVWDTNMGNLIKQLE